MVEAKEEIIEHLLPAQEGSILREKLKRLSLIYSIMRILEDQRSRTQSLTSLSRLSSSRFLFRFPIRSTVKTCRKRSPVDLSIPSFYHLQVDLSCQQDHPKSPSISVLTVFLDFDGLIQHQSRQVLGSCLTIGLTWFSLFMGYLMGSDADQSDGFLNPAISDCDSVAIRDPKNLSGLEQYEESKIPSSSHRL